MPCNVYVTMVQYRKKESRCKHGSKNIRHSSISHKGADQCIHMQRRNQGSCTALAGAVGTPSQEAETPKYIAELEEDILPIDNLIAFAESDQGKAYFGADTAAGITAHGKEIRKAEAKYCDCPACATAEKILAIKDAILA